MTNALLTNAARVFLTAFLLLALGFAEPVRAVDEVVLRSTGQSVKGTIGNVTKSGLDVEQTGKSTNVAVSDIAEIRWDGEPPELNISRIRERNGELAEALKSYQSLVQSVESSKTNLRTDIEFLIARTLARQAISDPSKKDAAVKALQGFENSYANSIRYYEAIRWLGEVQSSADAMTDAKLAYERLAKADSPVIQMEGQNALGRIMLKEKNYGGANAEFDKVIQAGGNDPAAMRQVFAAKLGKALVMQGEGKNDEALAALEEVIAQASADDVAVQAEAFLRKGTSLEAKNQYEDALLAFLHVDILFASESTVHAEALFHLVKLWEAVGKIDRSADARRRLTESYPNSQWAKQL